MGRDKLLLEVGGIPLVRRVEIALAARCAEVIEAGGHGRLPDTRHVPDARAGGLGPLAGMEAGLDAARHPFVFVAAGDLPLLPADLVGFLLLRMREQGSVAAVPRHAGRTHPLCAAYDRAIVARIRSELDAGTRSMRGFLGGLEGVDYVEEPLRRFGDPDLYLTNVNTRGDLERVRRICDGAP